MGFMCSRPSSSGLLGLMSRAHDEPPPLQRTLLRVRRQAHSVRGLRRSATVCDGSSSIQPRRRLHRGAASGCNFRLAAAPTVEPAGELTRSGEALHRPVTPEPHPDAAEGGLAYIWDVAAAEPPRPEAPIHTAALSDCAPPAGPSRARSRCGNSASPAPDPRRQTDRRGPIRRWPLEYYRQDILPSPPPPNQLAQAGQAVLSVTSVESSDEDDPAGLSAQHLVPLRGFAERCLERVFVRVEALEPGLVEIRVRSAEVDLGPQGASDPGHGNDERRRCQCPCRRMSDYRSAACP